MYYPAFLNLRAVSCVVVGGGNVAVRKVNDLLMAGASVKVIAPDAGLMLKAMAQERCLELIPREYRDGDLEGARLVISATDDPQVNRAVAAEARRVGAWVNVVDDPSLCDFIVPALVRRGDLVVAISTGGKSPAMARALRIEMEELLGPEYEIALNIIHGLRTELRQQGVAVSPEQWQEAIAMARDLLRDGADREDTSARVRALLTVEEG